ncbi:MAG: hypothetical protein LUI01_08460 [Firmicutes bacterium]|nr:hypothetical protein [Bacillota bacterium]
MIDIHCHIIPNVDDGSDGIETSLMMSAMAVDDGVRSIIATPHFMQGGDGCAERFEGLSVCADRLRAEISAAGIPLKIYMGAEVLLTPDTVNMQKSFGFFPRMNDTEYSLVEFFFDADPETMNSYLSTLLDSGIVPIIAHPERYNAVQKKRRTAEMWVETGCFLQVNKGSFQGQFGRRAEKTAVWMMENRLASFLATDAHNHADRTTRLKAVADMLREKYGEDYIALLTRENPERIIEGKQILRF